MTALLERKFMTISKWEVDKRIPKRKLEVVVLQLIRFLFVLDMSKNRMNLKNG